MIVLTHRRRPSFYIVAELWIPILDILEKIYPIITTPQQETGFKIPTIASMKWFVQHYV